MKLTKNQSNAVKMKTYVFSKGLKSFSKQIICEIPEMLSR